jgi:MerR family redox-sensitive transcriptional activator SoxR
MAEPALLAIGDLARRTGVSVSAIRFYEARGLIHPMRNTGGQRRFARSDIRRLSFILIAQQIGLTLEEIIAELARLPQERAPDRHDWAKISRRFRARLDAQISALERTRDRLEGCIGCGCLSLKVCEIYNAGDRAAARGAGPRFVLGDADESGTAAA